MAVGRATIDFFGSQRAARQRTALLLAWFVVAVAAVVALAYAALALPLLVVEGGPLLRPGLLAGVAAGVVAVTGGGCLYHGLALARGGGEALAEGLGGTRIDPASRRPEERRLLNVVEEMAIAAALPVPRVYLLAGEPGINALAAGPSPGHAVVAVTAGALEHLSRDELQAVVAHEFSHILNGDVRLNARLMGVVGGLTIISLVARETLLLAWPARREDWRGRLLLLPTGLVLSAAGALGVLCGQVVRCAVSRQREFLADAAAAQFTRDPGALARALLAISRHGSALRTPRALEASHFFFAHALGRTFERWLATHPPVEERVRRLEPGLAALPGGGTGSGEAVAGEGLAAPQGERSDPRPAAAPPRPLRPDAGGLAAAAGREVLWSDQLSRSRAALAALPAALRAAAGEAAGARALVTCLALSGDPATRAAQLEELARRRSSPPEALAAAAAPLGSEQRLVALDLALPALDGLGADEAGALRHELAGLAQLDRGVTVFEWTLRRLVERRLERRVSGRRAPPVRHRSVRQVEPECLLIVSLVAWGGTRDAAAAQAALARGLRELGVREPWRILPRERLSVAAAEGALRELDLCAPEVKRGVVRACFASVGADGRVTAAEAELLRGIAGSLGVPALPLLPTRRVASAAV